jgi:hypothetical protein
VIRVIFGQCLWHVGSKGLDHWISSIYGVIKKLLCHSIARAISIQFDVRCVRFDAEVTCLRYCGDESLSSHEVIITITFMIFLISSLQQHRSLLIINAINHDIKSSFSSVLDILLSILNAIIVSEGGTSYP